MASEAQTRIYNKKEAAVFGTTSGEFGALSNMAPDFPIVIQGVRIPTAEALYQACRFPDHPEIQRLIIDQLSPMTAKMKSKRYHDKTRSDWDGVRVNIMRWCLRAKLEQNWKRFGAALDRTGSRPIVEESRKDEFWGAKPKEAGTLFGRNVLGRLLMELRDQFRSVEGGHLGGVSYPSIPHFHLFGKPLGRVGMRTELRSDIQPSMFE
jgi:type I restriction enzyme S subunit